MRLFRHVRATARSTVVTAAVGALVAGLLTAVSVPAIAVAAEPMTASAASDGVAASAPSRIVPTADLTQFDPGNIMSDDLFYDDAAMTASEIQAFLDQRIGSCQNGRCLNIINTTISSRAARTSSSTGQLICGAIQGGTMHVSELIYRVQVACGISAKVLLVTLQKEQGLVTSRAPSDWNLNAAMGQACPDTAPCDPAFSGVGPQIVGGATQLKTYKAARFARQPGTHFIQYNPNAGCGGTNVTVANYATAALYNYTPYQPNRASLNAGYGLGDSCSSYGNRNFFNYYTDWFGSTQTTPQVHLVQHGAPVYLISGNTRYRITRDDIGEYRSVFGDPRQVDLSYVERFVHRGTASLYLRNASTGSVAFLQDGQRHLFSSCVQVAAWGSRCGEETSVTKDVYERVPAGARMSQFARVSVGGQVHLMEGDVLSPVLDDGTVAILNGGATPYAAVLPPSVSDRFSIGSTRFAPGRFIRLEDSRTVQLPTTDSRLLRLRSWAHAEEFGLATTSYRVGVSSAAASGYRADEDLSLFVRCASQTYFASQGQLRPVAEPATAGFPVTSLDSATCGELRLSSSSALERVYVRVAGTNGVLFATEGVFRLVTSRDLLTRLNGGTWPTVLTIGAGTRATLPMGANISWSSSWPWFGQPSGTLVRAQNTASVYLVDGDRGVALPNWDVGHELGISSSRLRIIDQNAMAGLASSGTSLRPIISCDEQTWVASNGVFYRITNDGLGGLPPLTLSADVCATLPLTGTEIVGKLFVDVRGQTYVADHGQLRPLEAGEAPVSLNNGVEPTVLEWRPGSLASVRAATS